MAQLASILLVSYLTSVAGVIVGCLIGVALWELRLPSLSIAPFCLKAGLELGLIGGVAVGVAAVGAVPKHRAGTICVGVGIVTVLSSVYFYYWCDVMAAL